MYVIVVCPRCHWGRIAREGQKTAGCPRCGYRISMKSARIFFRSTSLDEARAALGEVNRSIKGQDLTGIHSSRPTSAHTHTCLPKGRDLNEMEHAESLFSCGPVGLKHGRSFIERIRSLPRRFTLEEMANVLEIPMERAEKILLQMMESGEMYMPSPGIYEFVEKGFRSEEG